MKIETQQQKEIVEEIIEMLEGLKDEDYLLNPDTSIALLNSVQKKLQQALEEAEPTKDQFSRREVYGALSDVFCYLHQDFEFDLHDARKEFMNSLEEAEVEEEPKQEKDLEQLMEEYDLTAGDLPVNPPEDADLKELVKKIGKEKQEELKDMDKFEVQKKPELLREMLEQQQKIQDLKQELEEQEADKEEKPNFNPTSYERKQLDEHWIEQLSKQNKQLRKQLEEEREKRVDNRYLLERFRRRLEEKKERVDGLEQQREMMGQEIEWRKNNEEALKQELKEKEEKIEELEEMLEQERSGLAGWNPDKEMVMKQNRKLHQKNWELKQRIQQLKEEKPDVDEIMSDLEERRVKKTWDEMRLYSKNDVEKILKKHLEDKNQE